MLCSSWLRGWRLQNWDQFKHEHGCVACFHSQQKREREREGERKKERESERESRGLNPLHHSPGERERERERRRASNRASKPASERERENRWVRLEGSPNTKILKRCKLPQTQNKGIRAFVRSLAQYRSGNLATSLLQIVLASITHAEVAESGKCRHRCNSFAWPTASSAR